MEPNPNRLTQILVRAQELDVLRRGRFKLSSGRISDYYIDGRLLTLDSRGADLIGLTILDLLGSSQSIGGPAVGAVPIIAAVLAAAGRTDRPLRGFYDRPAPKGHGRDQRLEGGPQSPITLVDDTCTTGASLLELAGRLELAGETVTQIITVFDRGGGAKIEAAGRHYWSLLAVKEGRLIETGLSGPPPGGRS